MVHHRWRWIMLTNVTLDQLRVLVPISDAGI